MASGIYLLQDGGSLVEMAETAYDSEALLQELLATHPSLLAGDQFSPAIPRRWLLISREVGLASEEGGGSRWSVDHVFLDQDAVPTLVEVKRSTDTRIRREVVGQMLDYAANAVVYWPIETMRLQFERACAKSGHVAEQVLDEFLGADGDAEAFWQQAKTNLQAGRIRMVFVADAVPAELQRIVEFLNGQMDPAEVLAVEVRQFTGQGQTAMVPRVFGQTATAQQKKSPEKRGTDSGAARWDEASFMSELEARHGAAVVSAARQILDWARARELRIWWGNGKRSGSFFPLLDHAGDVHWTISAWTYGTIEIQFEMMKTRAPFSAEAKRIELLDRLNQVAGVSIPADAFGRRPGVSWRALCDNGSMPAFLHTLDWYVEQIRAL